MLKFFGIISGIEMPTELLLEQQSVVWIHSFGITPDTDDWPDFRQYRRMSLSFSVGVKIYKIAATNGYTWNFLVYTGQQDPTAGLGHAQTVVMNLYGLLGCYRTVVADNFFTTISLAKRLLGDDTYLIGTLRSNRAGSGNEVTQRKLRRGEVYGRQFETKETFSTHQERKNKLRKSLVLDYEGKDFLKKHITRVSGSQ